MSQLLELLGIANLPQEMKSRLILSSLSLLVFSILIYFWGISRKKIKANNKDGSGLVYISIAFFLYFLIGFVSIYRPIQSTYLILSALISICFLSSLSFFALGSHPVDHIVTKKSWKNGMKYTAFGWIIMISLTGGLDIMTYFDIALCVLSVAVLGFFITRYFIQRRLNFIALISVGYFVVFVVMQLLYPDSFADGKFVNMNRIYLGPGLVLSVIVLAYTFNWINELNFYELSSIWVGNDKSEEKNQEAYSKLTLSADKDAWLTKIAGDELEKVIEEIIILKKHKNENLEAILNIASRNTRNNNNQLKGLIPYEEYQMNRNKVSDSLMQLLKN